MELHRFINGKKKYVVVEGPHNSDTYILNGKFDGRIRCIKCNRRLDHRDIIVETKMNIHNHNTDECDNITLDIAHKAEWNIERDEQFFIFRRDFDHGDSSKFSIDVIFRCDYCGAKIPILNEEFEYEKWLHKHRNTLNNNGILMVGIIVNKILTKYFNPHPS